MFLLETWAQKSGEMLHILYSKNTKLTLRYENSEKETVVSLFQAIDNQNIIEITKLVEKIKDIKFTIGMNADEEMKPLTFAAIRKSSDPIFTIIFNANPDSLYSLLLAVFWEKKVEVKYSKLATNLLYERPDYYKHIKGIMRFVQFVPEFPGLVKEVHHEKEGIIRAGVTPSLKLILPRELIDIIFDYAIIPLPKEIQGMWTIAK